MTIRRKDLQDEIKQLIGKNTALDLPEARSGLLPSV